MSQEPAKDWSEIALIYTRKNPTACQQDVFETAL